MENTGKIRHGWALLEVLGFLGYAAERYLLSCTSEVPDHLKTLIYSAHRHFIAGADAHYSNMGADEVRERIQDGLNNLEEVSRAIGSGEKIPEELGHILKGLYAIAKKNVL